MAFDATIKEYLRAIDEASLLTKEQEQELGLAQVQIHYTVLELILQDSLLEVVQVILQVRVRVMPLQW